MRLNRLSLLLAVLLLAFLFWAWSDGGREPVHTIIEPVAVPELPR